MRLSDAFISPDKTGDFEWTATVININEDRLKGIHKNCKSLYDYAKFIAKVRECAKGGSPTAEQVAQAVDWAIREKLLDGFFERQKAEVIGMMLTEFDEQKFIQTCREDGAHEKAIETATNMLTMNVGTPEQISKITGLSLDQVQELAARSAPALN